jgi:hypothetical protein
VCVTTDKPKTYTTKTGKILTDADIEQMAARRSAATTCKR